MLKVTPKKWHWILLGWILGVGTSAGILVGLFMLGNSSAPQVSPKPIDYGALSQKIKNGEIRKLDIKPNEVVSSDNYGETYRTSLSNDFAKADLMKLAASTKEGDNKPYVAQIEEEAQSSGMWLSMFLWYSPLGLILCGIIGIAVILLRGHSSKLR